MADQGRRMVLLGPAAFACLGAGASPTGFASSLHNLEQRIGGRIGVAALNTATGRYLAWRAHERFAMASTFKWLLAACILDLAQRRQLNVDDSIAYGAAALLPHSPVTAAHIRQGRLSIATLAKAAVEQSDNCAANLLLERCGGPAGVTRFLRKVGDVTTRLDRWELALNSNLPGDERDTTTPSAMIATMQTILVSETLGNDQRRLLISWMIRCKTGQSRLRAGLPGRWLAGDKTGTGENGAVNDVAITWPEAARPPILIASYMSGSTAPLDVVEASHARLGELVAAASV